MKTSFLKLSLPIFKVGSLFNNRIIMAALFMCFLCCAASDVGAKTKWNFKTITAEQLTNGGGSNCWTSGSTYYTANNNYRYSDGTTIGSTITANAEVKITDGSGNDLFPGLTVYSTADRQVDYLRYYVGNGFMFNSGDNGRLKFTATSTHYYKVKYSRNTGTGACGFVSIDSGAEAITDLSITNGTDGSAIIKATGNEIKLRIKSNTVINSIEEFVDLYDYETTGTAPRWQKKDSETDVDMTGTVTDGYESWSKTTRKSRAVALDLSSYKFTADTYYLSFDALLQKGDDTGNNNLSEFALLSVAPDVNTNSGYATSSKNTPIFSIKSHNAGGWYLSTDTEESTALDIDKQWVHIVFTVNRKTGEMTYEITKKEDNASVASGSITLAEGSKTIKGLRSLIGYNTSATMSTPVLFQFDNLMVDEDVTNYYLNFETKEVTYDITDQDFTEPTMHYNDNGNAGATIEYEFSNSSIAGTGEQKTGSKEKEIVFYEGGVVTITAKLMVGGEVKSSDSYTVTVEAGDASYDITNNKTLGTVLTLTGAGKLSERIVEIPGLTMEFGNVDDEITTGVDNNNITLVKNYGSGYVAETLGNDGWRDFVPTITDGNEIPTQGTYFTFKPTVGGTLTINGTNYTSTEGTYNTVLMAFDGSTYTPVSSTELNVASISNQQYTIEAGKTYYLYGKNEHCTGVADGIWTVFQLHSFAFKSSFQFENTSMTVSKDVIATYNNNVPQSVSATNVVYKLWDDQTNAYVNGSAQGGSGGMRATINASTGAITYVSGEGGALIVTCQSTDPELTGARSHYVITIPYGAHTWDFTTIADKTVAQVMAANDDWAINYKIRSYTTDGSKMLKYLNKPVWTNSAPVDGDNAMFVNESAGLVINGSARSFGVNVTAISTPSEALNARTELDPSDPDYIDKNSSEYTALLNNALRQELLFDEDDIKDPNLMPIGKSVVTIPSLTAGQYVIMYWSRHAKNSGDKFVITNLTDLSGKDIGADFSITSLLTSGEGAGNGAYIMRVKADGDVTFTPQSGWTDIHKIVVTDVLPTEMRLVKDNNGHAGDPITLENASLTYRGTLSADNPVELKVARGSAASYMPQQSYDEFEIFSDDFVFEVESKTGSIKDEPGETVINASRSTKVSTSGSNTYNPVIFRLKGCKTNKGYGHIKIVQRTYDMSSNYLIGRKETWVAVGKIDVLTYPATWDFTSRNMNASPDGSNYKAIANGTTDTYAQWNSTTKGLRTAVMTTDSLGMNIEKPLFAQGSQLSIGTRATDAVAETKGLGVAYNNAEVGTEGLTLAAFDDNTGGLYLPQGGTLTVPNVSWGNNTSNPTCLFVIADKAPIVTWNGNTIDHSTDKATLFDLKDEVYVYPVPSTGSESDMLVDFPTESHVAKVAISNQVKTLTNTQGKLTESRDIAIDYVQTRELSNNQVHALVVPNTGNDYFSYIDDNHSLLTFTEVDCVAANNGILLFNRDSENNAKGKPANATAKMALFAPPVNVTPADYSTTSPLKANVTNTVWPASDDENWYFVFTDTYKTIFTGNQTYSYDDFCFSKVYSSGTQAAKTAVLQLPVSLFDQQPTGAKQIVLLSLPEFLKDNNDTQEATAINNVNGNVNEKANVIYDIMGRKVSDNGSLNSQLPKGLYIYKGKKIIMK